MKKSRIDQLWFEYRLCGFGDVAELADIESLTFSTKDAWSEEDFHKFLSKPDTTCEVVDYARRVIAYLMTHSVSDGTYIDGIAVHPTYQGRGIASSLLVKLIKQGRPIHLHVRSDNVAAIKLYQKLGFEVEEVCFNHYEEGGHGLAMTLPCSGAKAPERKTMDARTINSLKCAVNLEAAARILREVNCIRNFPADYTLLGKMIRQIDDWSDRAYAQATNGTTSEAADPEAADAA